jgi:hypothetical protein
MILQMSGLRFVVSVAAASIACLVYAGTAAALDGSTPVVAGVTVATSGSVASASVQVGSGQLDANVAVSSEASDQGPSLASVSVSVSPSVEAKVGAAGAGDRASVDVATDSGSVAPPRTSGGQIRPIGRDVPKTRPSNRVVRHSRPAAKPSGDEAPAARLTTPPLRPQPEQPAVRSASHTGSGFVTSGDSRPPSPDGAGFGGGSGLAIAAIVVAFAFLAAPRCGRRLRPTAERARPPALLSALERPG